MTHFASRSAQVGTLLALASFGGCGTEERAPDAEKALAEAPLQGGSLDELAAPAVSTEMTAPTAEKVLAEAAKRLTALLDSETFIAGFSPYQDILRWRDFDSDEQFEVLADALGRLRQFDSSLVDYRMARFSLSGRRLELMATENCQNTLDLIGGGSAPQVERQDISNRWEELDWKKALLDRREEELRDQAEKLREDFLALKETYLDDK
ncbi:hypothetical protein MRY87_08545 [bacterium]|nr:hypothetical protein [bacterium]